MNNCLEKNFGYNYNAGYGAKFYTFDEIHTLPTFEYVKDEISHQFCKIFTNALHEISKKCLVTKEISVFRGMAVEKHLDIFDREGRFKDITATSLSVVLPLFFYILLRYQKNKKKKTLIFHEYSLFEGCNIVPILRGTKNKYENEVLIPQGHKYIPTITKRGESAFKIIVDLITSRDIEYNYLKDLPNVTKGLKHILLLVENNFVKLIYQKFTVINTEYNDPSYTSLRYDQITPRFHTITYEPVRENIDHFYTKKRDPDDKDFGSAGGILSTFYKGKVFILLGKERGGSDKDTFCTMLGKVDVGETFEGAAIKEIYEETANTYNFTTLRPFSFITIKTPDNRHHTVWSVSVNYIDLVKFYDKLKIAKEKSGAWYKGTRRSTFYKHSYEMSTYIWLPYIALSYIFFSFNNMELRKEYNVSFLKFEKILQKDKKGVEYPTLKLTYDKIRTTHGTENNYAFILRPIMCMFFNEDVKNARLSIVCSIRKYAEKYCSIIKNLNPSILFGNNETALFLYNSFSVNSSLLLPVTVKEMKIDLQMTPSDINNQHLKSVYYLYFDRYDIYSKFKYRLNYKTDNDQQTFQNCALCKNESSRYICDTCCNTETALSKFDVNFFTYKNYSHAEELAKPFSEHKWNFYFF